MASIVGFGSDKASSPTFGELPMVSKVALSIGAAGLFFWVLNILQELSFAFGRALTEKRIPLIDIDGEAGVYTWISSTCLLFNGLALLAIASRKAAAGDRFAVHWRWLGVGFVVMSADESVRIHETVNALLKGQVQTGGLFHYAWVIPAILLCLVIGFAYLRFLRALPLKLRVGIIAAAALYLGGAVGMEMLSGWLYAGDTGRFGYRMLAALEEGGELAGASLLLFLLGRHWRSLTGWAA